MFASSLRITLLSPVLDFEINLRIFVFILIFIQKLNQTETLSTRASTDRTLLQALLLVLLLPIELRSTRVALLATVASWIGHVGKFGGTGGTPLSDTSSNTDCPSRRWENVWQWNNHRPGLSALNLTIAKPPFGMVTVVPFLGFSKLYSIGTFSFRSVVVQPRPSLPTHLKAGWFMSGYSPWPNAGLRVLYP